MSISLSGLPTYGSSRIDRHFTMTASDETDCCGLSASRDALVRHHKTVHGAQAEDSQPRGTRKIRQKRARVACQSCRRQKQRCDGCNPCGRCQLRKSVCDFSTPSKDSAVSQKLTGLSVAGRDEVNSVPLLEGCGVDFLSGADASGLEWARVAVTAPSSTQSRFACHTESTQLQKTFESSGLSLFMRNSSLF